MDTFTVVMLEKISFLAIRMRKVLEGSKLCVIDTENENKLLSTLNNSQQKASLVLLDLDISDEYAMNLLAETRKRLTGTPIIVLTSGGKKEFFVEAMLQGATDFIIKPFGNELLVSRVFKYLMPEESGKTELVTMDLQKCIKGELRKAEKGFFALSIMFLNIENDLNEEINDAEILSVVFENLRSLFWDTDIFIRFLSRYSLGLFPFCDEKSRVTIETKIKKRFDEVKQTRSELGGYTLKTVFVSYPFDTKETSAFYNLLISRIKETFTGIQI